MKINIPEKCNEEMFAAFVRGYNEESPKYLIPAQSSKCGIYGGMNAVLSHLRGEGKAGVGTPPAIQEPNPDDVERVARAMVEARPGCYWNGCSAMTQREWLQSATAAIRAMNGQLWGVWDNERNEWMKMPGSETDFTTTCTAAATCVCCVQPNKSLRILPYKATESGIVVCVSKEWSKDLITSKLCVRDNTGSVRAWIQNTGDEEGDYEIAKAVDARLRLASVAAEVRPYTAPREESAEEIAMSILTPPMFYSESFMKDAQARVAQAIREAEKRGTAKCG